MFEIHNGRGQGIGNGCRIVNMHSLFAQLPELVVPEQLAHRQELKEDIICQAMEEHHELHVKSIYSRSNIIEASFSPISGSFKHLAVLSSQLKKLIGNDELAIRISILPEGEDDPKHWLMQRNEVYNLGSQIAYFDKDRSALNLALPVSILNREKLGEALFYSGRAIWKLFNEEISYELLLKLSSPVGFWQKLQIGRLIRWNEAMANCMGLYFCRDLNGARQALIRDELGLDSASVQCDWSVYSFPTNFEVVPESEIMELPFPTVKADPFYFYIIEQFSRTDVFRGDAKPIASKDWEGFCETAKQAREHVHPELEEMPEGDRRYRQHLMILTQYLVAEADEVLRAEEIAAIEKNTDPEELHFLEEEMGWVRGAGGNTQDIALAVLESGSESLRSRHAAEVLYGCLATSYSDGVQCDKEFEVILAIAQKLGIEEGDFVAIYNKAQELLEQKASTDEVFV